MFSMHVRLRDSLVPRLPCSLLGFGTTLKREVNSSERSDSPGQICLNVGMDDDEYNDDGFSPLVSVCVRFWIG